MVREPPLEDPDRTWGYVDQPDLPLSPPLTPRKKKDSDLSLFTPPPPDLTVTFTRLFSLKRKKKVNHSESYPDLRSYRCLQPELPKAEFAGGLINIDHVVNAWTHFLTEMPRYL